MDEKKSLCVSMGVVKKALSAANSSPVLCNLLRKLAWDLPRIAVIWDRDSEHCNPVVFGFYYFPLNLSNSLNNAHSRVQDSAPNNQHWQEWLLPERALLAACLSGWMDDLVHVCTCVSKGPLERKSLCHQWPVSLINLCLLHLERNRHCQHSHLPA